MPEPTNLDAITTWCHTCARPVSMPHEHGDAPPTPTVIASDIALAEKWFRSSPGDLVSRKAAMASMATGIAAAREAWGAELTAELQGLREIAMSGPSTATGPDPLSDRPERMSDRPSMETQALMQYPTADIRCHRIWKGDKYVAVTPVGHLQPAGTLMSLCGRQTGGNDYVTEDALRLCAHCVTKALRAALERVKEGGSARE